MSGHVIEGDVDTVTTVTADGVALVVDLYAPPGRPVAAVVVAHGFTAHRRDPNVAALAACLRAEGYAVVVPDLRGHGESDGVCTLGDAEGNDVAAAVDVARRERVPVVVLGASMGAIAVLRYGATADDLAGVVTVSCPARWRLQGLRTLLAAGITRTPPGRWFLRRHANVRVATRTATAEAPEHLASRIDCPLAIVHGLADRFMPALEASRLHGRATGHRRLDLVPAMGHAFDEVGQGTIVAAVAWCLTAEHVIAPTA